ncbi:FHA domain-containing protein FhaB [bacterium HR33]|nr:FHA domain-containing protein FhaB [bacterium HR33]
MSYVEIEGKRYTIPAGETRIGSDPGCQIVLAGSGIMGVHAILQGLPDGQVAIKRAGSDAEILINGVRLGPQPSPLLHGDKVQIGDHELLFVDERRSGSTQYIQAVNPALLAQARGAKPSAKPRQPTAGTGGRVVSLTDGREYVITGTSMVFGRDAGCDVVITDRNVSRRHCEILSTPKGYLLIDSSTNGTFVNGERVEGQKLLARGDVIRIGNEEFRFYADVVKEPPAGEVLAAPPAAGAEEKVPEPLAEPAPPGQGEPSGERPARPQPPPGAEYRLAHTQMGIPARPAAKDTSAPAPAPPAIKSSKAPAVLANLVVRSGELKGQRLPIRVPIVNVGRAEYNDIVLPDDSVSTVHAKIQRREGIWVLVDLDSTNGTFVDGEMVQGEAPLSPGAIVRFGTVQTIFEPVDDTIDAAKGSSTKLMSAIRMPPPEPPSSGGSGPPGS